MSIETAPIVEFPLFVIPGLPLDGEIGSCGVCMEPLQTNEKRFVCTCGHSQCLSCFEDYLEHCCENPIERFPLRCPIPDCKTDISNDTISALFCSDVNEWKDEAILFRDESKDDVTGSDTLFEKLMEMQLKSSLMKLEQFGETAISCAKCELYVEIFPYDYRGRARRLVKAMKEVQKQQTEANPIKPKLSRFRQIIQRIFGGRTRNQKKKSNKTSKPKPRSSVPSTDKPSKKTVSSTVTDLNSTLSHALEDIVDGAYASCLCGGDISEAVDMNSESDDSHPEVELCSGDHDDQQKHIAEAETRLIDMLNITSNYHIKVSKVAEDPDINLTSQFFRCRRPECNYTVCLRCEKEVYCAAGVSSNNTLTQGEQEMENHCCEMNEVDDLYMEVLDILAEGSHTRCPQCQYKWKKDLNCCHMSCENCSTSFCYVCGEKPDENNGYNEHNQWSVVSDPTKTCPMYLKYKYGEEYQESSSLADGSAERALHLFHVDKQRRLMQSKQEEYKDKANVWKLMMETYFPKGIWDQNDLDFLDGLERRKAAHQAYLDRQPRDAAPEQPVPEEIQIQVQMPMPPMQMQMRMPMPIQLQQQQQRQVFLDNIQAVEAPQQIQFFADIDEEVDIFEATEDNEEEYEDMSIILV